MALAVLMPVVVPPMTGWPRDTAAAEGPIRHLRVALPDDPSARTIGFYLAQQFGAFGKRGLQLDFIASGDRSPIQLLNEGKADLAVEIMPVALRWREKDVAIQHVAQFFQHSGLALYCRQPIKQPADLHGATVGLWFGDQESAFYAWMSRLNIGTFGEQDGVTVLHQERDPQALMNRRSNCITSTSYLLPIQAKLGQMSARDLAAFRYDDLGVATLEDRLYARSRDLKDKARLELFAGFLAGAMQGWRQLHDDRAGALRLLRQLSADTAAAGSRTEGQPEGTRLDDGALFDSLAAVDALIDSGTRLPGRLDPAAYDRTINILLTGAPAPVLARAPAGALSDVVWKRLQRAR